MDRNAIISYSNKFKSDGLNEFYKNMSNIIFDATNKISNKWGRSKGIILNVNNIQIFPIGDYSNGTAIDNISELEIVVAINDYSIFLNLKNKNNKKDEKQDFFEELLSNYLYQLKEYFNESTMLILVQEGIKILCYNEYEYKLLIRFCAYDKNEKNPILYFYNTFSKDYYKVDLFNYIEKFEEKDKLTSGNYKKLVRIYKNLRKTILINKYAKSSDFNKYFIELLIYNIPNEIMLDKDIYLVFKKSFLYLTNCKIKKIKSYDNSNLKSFDFSKMSYYKIANFIKLIKKVI